MIQEKKDVLHTCSVWHVLTVVIHFTSILTILHACHSASAFQGVLHLSYMSLYHSYLLIKSAYIHLHVVIMQLDKKIHIESLQKYRRGSSYLS